MLPPRPTERVIYLLVIVLALVVLLFLAISPAEFFNTDSVYGAF